MATMHALDPSRNRAGFSILELITVLVIGGVLVGITINSFSRVGGRMGVSSARSNFMSLNAQARSFAVERGVVVRLIVDPEANVVRVETGPAGAPVVLNRIDLQREFGVDIQVPAGALSPAGTLVLCMTPRGIANTACNSFAGATRLTFVRGDREARLDLLPLGQAREA